MTDREYLQRAIDVSRQCVRCSTAYCVGAVIVTADGEIFEGFTHETGPNNHAEEEAIGKALAAGAELKGATIYASMEPCSRRASKTVSCSELIIPHGFALVVYAFAEPDHFVKCDGTNLLREAGIEVDVIDDLAPLVCRINSHIIQSILNTDMPDNSCANN